MAIARIAAGGSLLGELVVAVRSRQRSPAPRTDRVVKAVQTASALLASLPHRAPASGLVSRYCRQGRGSVSRRPNENQTSVKPLVATAGDAAKAESWADFLYFGHDYFFARLCNAAEVILLLLTAWQIFLGQNKIRALFSRLFCLNYSIRDSFKCLF